MRITGLVIALGMVVAAQARPDLNAFLNNRAGNLTQLIAQVKRDPEVRDRFRRHFGMNDAELLAYLSTLRAQRMTKKGSYIVYSVPPDGHIKAHVETYHPGTGMYVDITGTPILIAKCGNPLHRGPKGVIAENDVETAISQAIDKGRPMDGEAVPGDEIIDSSTIMIPETPLEPIIETEGGRPIIIPVAAPVFSPWLLGLLGLGLIDIDTGGGGNGTDLVPEPAALAALGIGIVALTRRKRSKSALV